MDGRFQVSIVSLLTLALAAGCNRSTSEGGGEPAASAPSAASAPEEASGLLSPQEFQSKRSTASGVLIDVRTPEEVAEGRIAGSKNINFRADDFSEQVSTLPKDEPVFLYCRSGGRSGRATSQLREMGFSEVYDLDGGITAWEAQGLPVEK